MAKPPLTLICNPVSGRGTGTRRLGEVERLLRSVDLPYVKRVTESSGHAEVLARESATNGADVVVACGGDGTISQVANGLVGTGAKLGLLPLGTGNDLARHFSLEHLETAVAALVRNEAHPVDLIAWETQERSGRFINVAGCGFDAVVADRINQGFRGLSGTTAYVAAVVSTLFKFRPAQISLQIDGEVIDSDVMLCAVANASSYGGGMKIAPNANIDDGVIDCVLVKGVGRTEFLKTFPKVFKGAHLQHPAVSVYRGRSIQISSEPALPLLCDGELVGSTPVTFQVEPSALSVIY